MEAPKKEQTTKIENDGDDVSSKVDYLMQGVAQLNEVVRRQIEMVEELNYQFHMLKLVIDKQTESHAELEKQIPSKQESKTVPREQRKGAIVGVCITTGKPCKLCAVLLQNPSSVECRFAIQKKDGHLQESVEV